MKPLTILLLLAAVAVPTADVGAQTHTQSHWWQILQYLNQNTVFYYAYVPQLWSPPAPVITDIPDDDGEPGTWVDLVGQNFDNLSFSPYLSATATPQVNMVSRGDQYSRLGLSVTVVSPTLLRFRIPTDAEWGGYDIQLFKRFQSSTSGVAPWTEDVATAPDDFVVTGDARLHGIRNADNRWGLEQVFINGIPILPPGTVISPYATYNPGLFTLDAGRWGRKYLIEVKYVGRPRVTWRADYMVYPLAQFQLDVMHP